MTPQNTPMLRVFRRGTLIQRAACVAVIAMVCRLGPSHAKAADLQQQIDPLAKQLIDDDQAVGFVVGIFAEGKEQTFAYGESERGSGKLPDNKTLYEIGSSTKPFTALLLAQAIEEDRMKFEDPVQKFLPKHVTMPEFETKPVTLEGQPFLLADRGVLARGFEGG